MDVPKRERDEEEEEDGNERQSKQIKEAELRYTFMTPQEREQMAAGIFNEMPIEWRKVIAEVSVGTLMKLAQTSRMFAEWARNDTVWQRFFERDFPSEWTFCKGQLPFFVLNPDHILFTEHLERRQFNSTTEGPAWKRYYLHTEVQYRDFAVIFINRYRQSMKQRGGVPGLSIEWANMREIYNWVHRVPLRMRFEDFDYRAALAWHVVDLLYVLLAAEGNLPFAEAPVLTLVQYALGDPSREWLLPYVLYANPGTTLNNGLSEEAADNQYGPTIDALYEGLVGDNDDFTLSDQWYGWAQKQPPASMATVKLFSEEDREKIKVLLKQPTMPGLQGLRRKVLERKKWTVLRCWDILSASYNIPCIYSLPFIGKQFSSWLSAAAMIRHPGSIFNVISTLISYGGSLILPPVHPTLFDMDKHHEIFIQVSMPFSVIDKHMQGAEEFSSYNHYDEMLHLFRIYSYLPRNDSGAIIHLENCIQCGKQPANPQHCGGTCQQKAIYCGKECQMQHWISGHQNECHKRVH